MGYSWLQLPGPAQGISELCGYLGPLWLPEVSQEQMKLQFNVLCKYMYIVIIYMFLIGNDKRRRGAPKSILLKAP